MPVLTTPDEVRHQLGGAIRDRDHYVFIVDTDAGKTLVRRFLLGVTSLYGVADGAVLYAEFPFLVASVGVSRQVAVLAVHKLALPRRAVATFLALFGAHGSLPRDADLFPLTESDDPSFLAGVLELIRRGDVFPVAVGVN